MNNNQKRYDNLSTYDLSNKVIGHQFWCFRTTKTGMLISGLYFLNIRLWLMEQGYFKRTINGESVFVHIRSGVMTKVTPEIIRDVIMKEIEDNQLPIDFKYNEINYIFSKNCLLQHFFQYNPSSFSDNALKQLDADNTPILKDEKDKAYFLFKNVIVIAAAGELLALTYADLKDKVVWNDHIIPYDFQINNDHQCHFLDFLKNVCDKDDERLRSLKSVIGYLLHNYQAPTSGKAVVFYDQKISTSAGNPMGGSGKGLLTNGLGIFRNLRRLDGKDFSEKNTFKYAMVTEDTQLVAIDDVKSTFQFSVLHSVLTEGYTINKKFKNQFTIPLENGPKTIITSNYLLHAKGTTNLRRLVEVELSDHYSKKIITGVEKPIEEEHHCVFFSEDWDAAQWNSFFNLGMECIQLFLREGILINAKQFKYQRLRQEVGMDFLEYIEDKISPGLKYNTSEIYGDFGKDFPLFDVPMTQRKFSDCIREWAVYNGLEYVASSSNGQQYFILNGKPK